VRAVSKKRAAANRLRVKNLAHVREFQTWCSKCGQTGVGLDAHELKSRAQGGSITDLENIVLLCRPCHQQITENHREAAEQGWAVSKKWGAA
jgi:5-methylcytosine-specific restriction endonuclease McrA